MYAMKGVLNLQFREAFIAALQRLYMDERFFARSCREMANHETTSERHNLLMQLALRADRNALGCGMLLYRLGCPIRSGSHRAHGQRSSQPVVRPLGCSILADMERIESADFHRLLRLCSAQRQWV
jgi:hypothetical protein